MTPLDLRALAIEWLVSPEQDQPSLGSLLALLERVAADARDRALEEAASRLLQYPDLDQRSAEYAARCIRSMRTK